MQAYTPLKDWYLAGYYPFTPILAASPETGVGSGCVTPRIPASVPGSVYADLLRAGLLEDPYFGRNSMLAEWVKDRFWVYETVFTPEKKQEGERVFLHLDGIDYHAHISLDGVKLAEHENMFVPLVLDITERITYGKETRLQVILEAAPDEMGQIGYTERTHTQKARYTYKWDFGTRLVGMGLWGEVYLEQIVAARVLDTAITFDGETLHVLAHTDAPAMLNFYLQKDGKTLAQVAAKDGDAVRIPIEAPQLWYPNGAGAQPLYTVITAVVGEGGEVLSRHSERIGLRTLAYRRCDGAREDALPYIPIVNGKEICIKGVNMVPMDLMTGTETGEKRRKLLSMVREMGCNLVRVWGGGIIECEDFYRICDEYGIMVWQEMPQSSSGISNQPSKDPHFLALLKETASYTAKARRNHPCLIFLSGGNELTDANGVPSTFADENLAMLKGIFDVLCPDILMLPTSASGPTEYGLPDPADNHDVHGPWKYAGVEGHYRLFNTSSIQLHSEFGVDGMTNEAILPSFLAKEDRKKIETVEGNLTWRHHGEWWDTYTYRDLPLFGEMQGELSTFITVSQYMQAEGLRYAVESNRRRQWQCAGSIIWQFNEPWPGVTGTNLVDYEGNPKTAYYFVQDAYAPFHVSLRYDKLVWGEGETFKGEAFLHDDTANPPCMSAGSCDALRITLLDEHGIPAASFASPHFSFLTSNLGRSFSLRIEAQKGEKKTANTYLFFLCSPAHPTASPSAVRSFLRGYFARKQAKQV